MHKQITLLAKLSGLVRSRDAIQQEITDIRTNDARWSDTESIASLPGLFASIQSLNATITEIQNAFDSQPNASNFLFGPRSASHTDERQREKWHQLASAEQLRADSEPPAVDEPRKRGRPKGSLNNVQTKSKYLQKRSHIDSVSSVDTSQWITGAEAGAILHLASGSLRHLADKGHVKRKYVARPEGGHPVPMYNRADVNRRAPASEHKKGMWTAEQRKRASESTKKRWREARKALGEGNVKNLGAVKAEAPQVQ